MTICKRFRTSVALAMITLLVMQSGFKPHLLAQSPAQQGIAGVQLSQCSEEVQTFYYFAKSLSEFSNVVVTDIEKCKKLLSTAITKNALEVREGQGRNQEHFWRVIVKGCEWTLLAAANCPKKFDLAQLKRDIATALVNAIQALPREDPNRALLAQFIQSLENDKSRSQIIKDAKNAKSLLANLGEDATAQQLKTILDKLDDLEKQIDLLKKNPNESGVGMAFDLATTILSGVTEIELDMKSPNLNVIAQAFSNVLPAVMILVKELEDFDAKKFKELLEEFRDAIQLGVNALMAVQFALEIETAGMKAVFLEIIAELLKLLDLGIKILPGGEPPPGRADKDEPRKPADMSPAKIAADQSYSKDVDRKLSEASKIIEGLNAKAAQKKELQSIVENMRNGKDQSEELQKLKETIDPTEPAPPVVENLQRLNNELRGRQ